MKLEGKGSIKLGINGLVHVVTNILFIAEFKNNLLSVGQLQQKGLAVLFKDNVCKVYHQERGVLMTSRMSTNRLFVVIASITTPQCLQVSGTNDYKLWHRRCRHLSFKDLNTLSQRKMVRGLPTFKDPENVCEDCMIGKQHRDSIPKQSTWRASRRLELIHAEICGLINPSSNGSKMYFITFIDNPSRKTDCCF